MMLYTYLDFALVLQEVINSLCVDLEFQVAETNFKQMGTKEDNVQIS